MGFCKEERIVRYSTSNLSKTRRKPGVVFSGPHRSLSESASRATLVPFRRYRTDQNKSLLRAATLRRPRARAGAALPVAGPGIAGEAPRSIGTLGAVADGYDDGAGRSDIAGNSEWVRTAIGEDTVGDADRVTIATVAVALFRNDGNAPHTVIARRRRV
jgi:hypothetical protein